MGDKNIMFIFPGQGSQYRGMGKDIHAAFPVARDVYSAASEALGYDMVKLSFEDPDDEIGLTRFTQPALLTHSIACLRVFEELTANAVKPGCAAGHSLGEYTALVMAESLTLEAGLKLVQKRGELMGEHGEGGMMALTMEVEAARAVADRHYCQVASCNLPEQTVVGGRAADLESLAKDIADNYPRKRAIPLATEGAFHTYFMITAARLFREILDSAEINEPQFDVLANYTGDVHDADAESIRARLFFQLFSPVNWIGCLGTAMARGVDTFVEFGGGLGKAEEPSEKRPNLESIIKKTLKSRDYDADYVAVINCESIENAAKRFVDQGA
jgi:[acyl-carrier-protein] S-malonyltransferase